MGNTPDGGDAMLPAGKPSATQAQLRAVVENIDEGLVIADATGTVLTMNQRAREMIGYDREESEGGRHHVSDFPRYLEILTIDGRELAPNERPMARVMAGERFSDYELVCRQLRTGSEWVASFVGTPVRGVDGSVELAVLSARDITERKRAEEALQLASRQKDAFIAALAHELRNPLAPILTAAQLLERDRAEPDRRQRLAEIIARQATHLATIVDDLLDVSRITSGRIELHREVIDLGVLVGETAEDHRPGFEAAGIRLTVDVGPSPVWVDGDRTRLAQVIENLLSNALKFTDADGIVEVEVRVVDGGRTAVATVRDTGVGIDPSLAGTLWEPFSQGGRPPRHGSSGLGLGTALIRGLTELHGGRVAVASRGDGSGSEFTISLPVVAAPPQARQADDDARTATPAGSTVLVIEDNEDVATALVEVLRELGCEPRVAVNGAAGLEIARSWHPAVVLCDISLPGDIDGYEVARGLRQDGFPGLLVAMTGFGRAEDRDRSLASGFDRHATKPVSIDALAEIVGAEE